MKSTIEILTKLQENSQKNHDEIFTRLYRYLLRPDIYFIAYQHLYSNKGAGTKGVNDDTADGFSEQYVTAIIEAVSYTHLHRQFWMFFRRLSRMRSLISIPMYTTPVSYTHLTPKQMEDTIIKLLEQWQRKQQRQNER